MRRPRFFDDGKQSIYQEPDSRSDRRPGSIQNEIVHVGCALIEQELQDFNDERVEKAGSDRFDVRIQLSEYERPYESYGYEHGEVADDVSLPAIISVSEKLKCFQVELRRESVELRVDQAESAFGHREVEDNDNAYVDQEKHELVLHIRLMYPRNEEADEYQDDRDHEDGLCFMKDEHCKFL